MSPTLRARRAPAPRRAAAKRAKPARGAKPARPARGAKTAKPARDAKTAPNARPTKAAPTAKPAKSTRGGVVTPPAKFAPTIAQVLQRCIAAQALGGGARTVLEAQHRAAFIYGSAPTSQFAFAARVRGYAPAALDREVLETRELVRVRAMRGTVYLVPKALVPHALAISPIKSIAEYARMAGIEEKEYAPLAARIEETLAAGPLTTAEIREVLGDTAPDGTGLSLIIGRMSRDGRIVRAAVRGGPLSQSYEWALMANWVAPLEVQPTPLEALIALAPAWLEANGPATAADLAWWAGTSQRDAKAVLKAIGSRTLTVSGIEGELHASEATLASLSRRVDEDDAIHLVPCWDSYVMAHRDRSRYLDDARRAFVLDAVGNSTNVMLRAGRIVGLWDVDGATLLYAPFVPLAARTIEAAAPRLKPLAEIATVEKVPMPPPLASLPKNAFLAPLRTAGKGKYRR